jgi:hypothetical protein
LAFPAKQDSARDGIEGRHKIAFPKKVKIALATPIGFAIFRAPFLRHQRPVIFTAILTQNADNQSVGPQGPP